MNRFDVVIIGGGLGGLACGSILSREGLNVCVLEQNHTVGGCLQSFRRGGQTLDTGMHYVGSLSEGQIMHQYFKYFGVLGSLKLQKLDESGFDIFHFSDGNSYRHAMGYERFVDTLAGYFPDEYHGIRSLCSTIEHIGNLISVENLCEGKISGGGTSYMSVSAYGEIESHIKDRMLQRVMAGNCTLYAGNRSTTSLYEYGMITNSNIEGAYSFVDGSQQLADAFVDVIRSNGGQVFTSARVSRIVLQGNVAEYVVLDNGERYYGKNIISSLHPSLTFSMLDNNTVIRKAFFTRMNSLSNTYGLFTTYLVMKPHTLRYINRNNYFYNNPDVWSVEGEYKGYNIPSTLLCMQANSSGGYANVVTLLTPMALSACEKWFGTKVGNRGAEYIDFKSGFSEAVIDFVCQFFPELRSCIDKVYTASPLTYRDYTSTPGGSAYGIVKDYHNPMITHFPPRTRISNLLLTGQNMNIHGCLGTSVSAAVTCASLLGMEYLAKKIGYA